MAFADNGFSPTYFKILHSSPNKSDVVIRYD